MASKLNKQQELHFVLIPLMTPGHTIPMIDMAKLLAERGATVTFLLTPLNASRYGPVIRRVVASKGLSIRLQQIAFPCKDVGLPEGLESLDIVRSPDQISKFFDAIAKMQHPVEKYLLQTQISPPLSCIISDKYLAWTSQTARKLRIPRIIFHGTGCFALLSSHNIRERSSQYSNISEYEAFSVPGLPDGLQVEVTKAQLPGELVGNNQGLDDTYRSPIRDAELSAFGVVINSFEALENEFIQAYKKALLYKKSIWCVGPVSQCNKQSRDKFERGHNKASIDETECMSWLDAMEPQSVIYACLGSLCRLVPAQLIELGLGLEASNRPFIWVVKTSDKYLADMERWLEEERFEERVRGRGLVIKGWAPQVLILSHPAIAGFLTHCGWNSTIEAVSNGVPMVTWPLFSEQFLNERLVVEVLRIGIAVGGADMSVRWGQEERVGVLVRRDRVVKAVGRLLSRGEEGERRRESAREIGEMARESMEVGGSSHLGITLLMKDVLEWNSQHNRDSQHMLHN